MYGNGTGVLVATQRRLLFVDKGLIVGLKVEDIPLDKISSIQYSTGWLMGSIIIHTSGNKAEIKNVEKTQARRCAEAVRNRISEPRVASATRSTPSAPSAGVVAELEKLVNLHERGLLTVEEFSALKAKLIGG